MARTMTMAKIVRGGVTKLHNTDTCDLPEHFQAYDPNRITPKISQAVKATRGQVLLYDGKFAYVLFHSYAGSKTASLQESFPELTKIAGPYIQVMRSPGSKYAPAKERRWQAVVPKSELQPIFGTGANLTPSKLPAKAPVDEPLILLLVTKQSRATICEKFRLPASEIDLNFQN